MPKLPRLTSRKVLAALLRAGFYVHHQTGSHINLRHKIKSDIHVVIPKHNRDLALSTLKSVIVQSGLKLEEFTKLL